MNADGPNDQGAGENPHVLWRQLLGFVLWNGILGYALGEGIEGSAASLIIGGLPFADAWRSGMWKDSDRKSFVNISPMSWGIVVGLSANTFWFLVVFPVYAVARNKLARPEASKGFYFATLIVCGLLVLLYLFNLYTILSAA